MKKNILCVILSCAMVTLSVTPVFADEVIYQEESISEGDFGIEQADGDAVTYVSVSADGTVSQEERTLLRAEYRDMDEVEEESLAAIESLSGNIEGQCGNDIKYVLDSEGTLTLTGTGKMWDFRNDIDFFDYHGTRPWDDSIDLIKKVVISEGITSVGADAFNEGRNIESVSFPESLEAIGHFSFMYCEKLKDFVIPINVTAIYQQAFYGCDSLEHAVIPGHVTFMDSQLFADCDNLKSLKIDWDPNYQWGMYTHAVVSISNSSKKLESIEVAEGHPVYEAEDGVLYAENKTELISYIDTKTDEKFDIPEGIEKIAILAFDSNKYIREVSVPESLNDEAVSGGFIGCRVRHIINKSDINLKNFVVGEWTDDSTGEKVTEMKKGVYSKILTDDDCDMYTISFNANGGKGKKMESISNILYSSEISLCKCTYERKGYRFAGWNTKKNGKGTSFKDGATVSCLSEDGDNVVLYAQWKANSYKIKFNSNGGTGSVKTMSMTYGKEKKLTKNSFKKNGYKFAGWATSKANAKAGKVKYKNKATVKNLTDKNGKTVTLYAAWKQK